MNLIGLFKSKPVEFECIYRDNYDLDTSPIIMAGKQVAKDVKDMQSLSWPNKTMKTCPAFFMSKRFGFVVRSPFGLRVLSKHDGSAEVVCSDQFYNKNIQFHDPMQSDPFFKDFIVLKIQVDTSIKEKTGVNCFVRSAWQMNKSIYNDFSIPSGFTNFKYNNAVHVFILIPKKEGSEQEFIINKNDPLAHIIPLTEKEIVLTHKVDMNFVRIGDRCINTMAPEYLAREKMMKENEELLK